MTIDEMNRIKRLQGYSYRLLAEQTGIEAGTIQKILTGQTKNPRYETVYALNQFFGKKQDLVREAQPAYGKKQGDYTVADYWLTDEDEHVELIDGRFFVMETPSVIHQELISGAADILRNYIRKNGGKCRVFLSPIAVHLDTEDNKTVLEPDMIILCDPGQLHMDKGKYRNVDGAPDFVMEVLSPSTRKRDMTIKLHKYESAGVKEYWVVDPEADCVIVYQFDQEITPTIYPFSKPVPVGIYDSAVFIDFEAILKEFQAWTGSVTVST